MDAPAPATTPSGSGRVRQSRVSGAVASRQGNSRRGHMLSEAGSLYVNPGVCQGGGQGPTTALADAAVDGRAAGAEDLDIMSRHGVQMAREPPVSAFGGVPLHLAGKHARRV